MSIDNYTRMIHLAADIFDAKNDPSQLEIDEAVIDRLMALHHFTMGERLDDWGPIAWSIVIPTSEDAMNDFLKGILTESALLERSERERKFETVYLCSALVLPEHRRKGLATELLFESVRGIQRKHDISALYFWAFSSEGEHLAQVVAQQLHLPLFERKKF